jgi:hypothetical protein
MINVFIASIFSMMAFCLYSFSNKIISINRIVSSLPNSIFELSIDLINFDDEHLYFDQEKLENNVNLYFHDNIEKYTSNYVLDYIFLKSSDYSICVDGKADAVRINFSTILQFGYEFSRSLTYEIWG